MGKPLAHHSIQFSFRPSIGGGWGSKNQYATYAEQNGSTKPAKSAEQWAAEACAIASQTNSAGPEEQVQRDLCTKFRAAAAERSAIFDQQQVKIGWRHLIPSNSSP